MTMAAENPRRQRGAPARPRADNVAPLARLQRAAGMARVAFKRRGRATVLADIHQSGCCKVRFPAAEAGNAPDAILINTSGGLTDSDRIEIRAQWRAGTSAVVTTQAAERIYRSRGQPARMLNVLSVEEGATAFWLPQETILFDGSRLARMLEAEIAQGASLLACESTLFGRAAMGERVRGGALFDRWRIRHGGRLVFADGLRLDGDMEAALARPALGGGARAIASILYAGDHAEVLRDALRPVLAKCEGEGGCSVNGAVLLVRLLATEGAALRHTLVALLRTALEIAGGNTAAKTGTGVALPRVWSC